MELSSINNSLVNVSKHCSYEPGYEPIYAPTYIISFVFTDEDEIVEDYYEENDVTPSSSVIIYEAGSKK